MLTRALILLFEGKEPITVELPSTPHDELTSASEFVGLINTYKNGFERFMLRKPDLKISSKPTVHKSLDSVLHSLVNARKYLDMNASIDYSSKKYDQVFAIDFTSGTFTLYKLADKHHEDRGTMSLAMIYMNWVTLFYPDFIIPVATDRKELDALITTDGDMSVLVMEKPPSLIESYMAKELSSVEYELWSRYFGPAAEKNADGTLESVVIHYSGSGDSGQTDSITLSYGKDKLNKEDDPYFKFASDGRTTDDLIWDVINSKECGFYNNEGGYGSIVMDKRSFTWEHNNYYTETHNAVDLSIKYEDDVEITVDDKSDEEESWYDSDPTDYKDAEYDKTADD